MLLSDEINKKILLIRVNYNYRNLSISNYSWVK